MIMNWVAVVVLAASPAATGELAEGVKIKVGDEPIDVEVGHAAPCFYDLDGDGKKDLLVGQFGGGKLRVYTNKGTNDQPKYEGFEYLQAGGKDATVPFG